MTLEQEPGSDDDPAVRGLVLLTVERDGERAGDWHDALLDAGIDAELHIEDGAIFNLTSSAYPMGAPFVYALWVPRSDGPRAADVLIGLGWDGRGSPRASAMRVPARQSLRSAVIVLAVSLALVAVVILVRGG